VEQIDVGIAKHENKLVTRNFEKKWKIISTNTRKEQNN